MRNLLSGLGNGESLSSGDDGSVVLLLGLQHGDDVRETSSNTVVTEGIVRQHNLDLDTQDTLKVEKERTGRRGE